MASVEIREDGIIICHGDNGNDSFCDPLAMFCLSQHCGNCPVIRLMKRYDKEIYDID